MDEHPDVLAWRRFCERLAGIGESLLEARFPTSDAATTEGVHHLATQVSGWLEWAAGHDRVAHPSFFRQNDTVMRWGGPNVDQTTRRARVESGGRYRITGRMNGCEDFILTQKDGDMHERRYGIVHEVMASELGIGEGDRIDLLLCDVEPEADDLADALWVPLQPGATMVNLREYYWDWRPVEPAVVTIERVDTVGTSPGRLAPGEVGAMLDQAAQMVEQSLEYWNDYTHSERAKGVPNVMAAPTSASGGSSRIAYSFGFTELDDDEALLIECGAPTSRFWDIQLYSVGWFESLDFANRVTSLNHTQAEASPDGRVRFVVSGTDPAVRNWLDTGGRREVMITHRWIDGDASTIDSRVVRLADLREHLPAETPGFGLSQRREQIAARQRHVAWRYRT